MCSKSFLFILACQLVRHDTEAFFVVLYFPWNICHAILKKRRGAGYNHGWLLGWFAIWMEGILLTTVPLSGIYVFDYLIFCCWVRMTSHKGYLVIPSSIIWGIKFDAVQKSSKGWFPRNSLSIPLTAIIDVHITPIHTIGLLHFLGFDFKSWQMNQNLNGIEIQRALNSR